MAQTRIQNQLGPLRKSRGVSAVRLAERTGISRQTIYAIESGTYVPNTEVSLRLARELEVTVEEIFSLPQETADPPSIASDVLSQEAPAPGLPVRVCRVGTRWVSVPVSASPYYLPEADALIAKVNAKTARASLALFSPEPEESRMVLAGCDPAMSLLSSTVRKASGVEVISAAASSRLALQWLKQGKVHVAGSHLQDPASGEFNLPYIRRELAGEDIAVMTFANWESGLVIRPQAAHRIRTIADLAKRNVRFVNREPGSGSRALLDRLLSEAGIDAPQVHGYDSIAYGHLAAAYRVLMGDADCCMATRSAAHAFGLHFVPLHTERYDLVMRREVLQYSTVQSFLDALSRSTLRRKLESIAGYDTTHTGTWVA